MLIILRNIVEENNDFKFPSVSPEEMMGWLMEKNNHKQTDMTDVASRTVINEILNGKRKLNQGFWDVY